MIWFLYIKIHDHGGTIHNITLLPGHVLLYESMSVIHGRPYPLSGKSHATFYIHFIPTWNYFNNNKNFHHSHTSYPNIEELYKQRLLQEQRNLHATQKDTSSSSNKRDSDSSIPRQNILPHFIIPDSDEAKRWFQELKYTPLSSSSVVHEQQKQQKTSSNSVSAAHYAAIYNDLRALKRIAKNNHILLHIPDVNGWTPLHEASRAGHTNIVEFLLRQGVDVNVRTHEGRGESALYLAIRALGKDHPVVHILNQYGGKEVARDWIHQEDTSVGDDNAAVVKNQASTGQESDESMILEEVDDRTTEMDEITGKEEEEEDYEDDDSEAEYSTDEL